MPAAPASPHSVDAVCTVLCTRCVPQRDLTLTSSLQALPPPPGIGWRDVSCRQGLRDWTWSFFHNLSSAVPCAVTEACFFFFLNKYWIHLHLKELLIGKDFLLPFCSLFPVSLYFFWLSFYRHKVSVKQDGYIAEVRSAASYLRLTMRCWILTNLLRGSSACWVFLSR